MKNKFFTGVALIVLCSCAPKYNEGCVEYSIWKNYTEECIPDFNKFGKPDKTGVLKTFDISGCKDFKGDNYAAIFKSVLSVDKENDYTFYLSSDDGARFYVDGKLVVDLSESHDSTAVGKTTLYPGKHDLKIEYYEDCEGEILSLSMYQDGEIYRIYGAEGADEKMPSFVMNQAVDAFRRYERWKGDDEVVLFPMITDVHTHHRYTYQHIGYIAKTDELFRYDFMVNLGDIGLNLGASHDDKKYVETIIRLTLDEMSKYNGVFLYVAGNHDWDAGEGDYHTPEFMSDTFQKPGLKYAKGNLHLTPGEVYGYYDIPEKNTRMVFLNSSGTYTKGTYYIYDDKQVEWFKNLLEMTDPTTSIIVFSHYMPHPIGRWHNEPQPETKASNELMMSILSDYKAKRRIVGLFCGDSHVNAHEVKDGVNYFITQSYGFCTEELMMDNTKHAFSNYRESLCCDIVAIKPDKNEVHTFRMGAGGSDFDYQFTY